MRADFKVYDNSLEKNSQSPYGNAEVGSLTSTVVFTNHSYTMMPCYSEDKLKPDCASPTTGCMNNDQLQPQVSQQPVLPCGLVTVNQK